MMSSNGKKSKGDTWKADELERSIKAAMDGSEKRQKRSKSRKKDTADRRKEGAKEKYLTYSKFDHHKDHLKGHGQVDNDEDGSQTSDDTSHSAQDRLNKTEEKGNRFGKDDYVKEEQEQGQEKRRHIESDVDIGIPETHSWTPFSNNDYEDDFEEYEDDFEGLPGNVVFEGSQLELTEVEALRIAMKEENEATTRYSTDTVPPQSKSIANMSARGGLRQTFINFSAAKQRHVHSKASQNTMQRGRELMSLIDLDVSTCSFFEMPPVKVYEVYIKSYGRSDTKQAFVQCQDDVLDRDVQTESIEIRNIWTQHPSDGISPVCLCAEDNQVNKKDTVLMKVNSLRLSNFLEKAHQVMSAIFEEEVSCGRKSNLQNKQCKLQFSEGYTRLYSHLSILKGRHATYAEFHPVQSNLLLTVYSRSKVYDNCNSAQQSIICVWDIHNSSKPHRILSCRSEVTSSCFSPIKSTFIFAGTEDGAIVAWDLREPSSMHDSVQKDDGQLPVQVPTFSTYGGSRDDNHQSPVIKVQPVVITEESHWVTIPTTDDVLSTVDISGMSFQLGSLDERGVINFWVVLDLGQTDTGGSETDLGLVPGGKLKLLKSSSVVLENQIRDMLPAERAKNMQFSLRDPTQFFIATESGCILHGSRHGDIVSPRRYRKQTDCAVAVIHLDFSPFRLPCFLVGSSDGSICLYNLNQEAPLYTWDHSTSNMPIVSMMWSRSRPSVFYVADATSKVYVWELLTSQGGPVDIEQFTDGRLITMNLSNDHISGCGVQGRQPSMVVTDDSGAVDVHMLNNRFTVCSIDEFQQMTELLES